MTNKSHVHAEAMLEYAKDAMLTDEPWKLWQVSVFVRDGSEVWSDLTGNPQWGTSAKYQRKPKQKRYLIVNGVEIEQTDVKPKYEQKYYIAYVNSTEGYIETICWDDCHDERLWNLSLVHDTAEAAIAHTNALLKHDVTYRSFVFNLIKF